MDLCIKYSKEIVLSNDTGLTFFVIMGPKAPAHVLKRLNAKV